jgi:hypothetical protein
MWILRTLPFVLALLMGALYYRRSRLCFTYFDAVQYFTTRRPQDARIRKGALLRRSSPTGVGLYLVFIDENNAVCLNRVGTPYGIFIAAKKLNAELEEFFGSADLLILE